MTDGNNETAEMTSAKLRHKTNIIDNKKQKQRSSGSVAGGFQLMLVYPQTSLRTPSGHEDAPHGSAQGSPRLALRDWKAFSVTELLTHKAVESLHNKLAR